MDKQTFSFELIDKDTPDVVIRNSLKEIEERTRGYVTGHIQKYNGPISSYVKRTESAVTAALANFSDNHTIPVDIQSDLGEQDSEDNRFEVFVSAKELEHYKYRIMFVDYGAISYPVTVVMNEDLAKECTSRGTTRFKVGSMKELEIMMNTILNSQRMFNLFQSLIYESIRQENEKVNVKDDVECSAVK